jgi:hypothetical protein
MDILFTKIRVQIESLWSPKGVSYRGNKEARRPLLWPAGHDLSPNMLSLREKPNEASRNLVQASPIPMGQLED